MRWISVLNITDRRILSQNILDERGRILLAKGAQLTDSMVRRLMTMGITSVCVEDPLTEDVQVHEAISQQLRSSLVSATYDSLIELSQADVSRYIRTSSIRRKLQPIVEEVVACLSEVNGAREYLGNVYLTDGELYHHSVNVTLFALSLGLHQGLTSPELVELGIGALLHDLGKLKIKGAVLKKPGRLTDEEYEEIKRHTTLGYDILRRLQDLAPSSTLISLEHHERVDGTGYPRGLRKDEIHRFSRIVSVADVYEALTANRVYRKGYLPHQAYELLLGAGGIQFDQDVVKSFVDTIAVYPTGMTLELSTGERAVVVKSRPKQSHRPVVRIFADKEGNPVDKPYEIDLSESLTTEIVSYEN